MAAGYEDLGDDDNKFLVTAGYTMNNFTIAALYQNADFEDQDIDTVLLAGSYSMGNNTFVAKWGRTKDSYRDGTRATVWSLGAEHKLSKRSSVYVGYTNADENYQDDSMDGFSVGMIHNF
ncbi:porin [Solemya velum gill symbiont]|uniref:porin n=1 Tax=Solemya velum gill symbiont TaxID=2340 RepID=UPI0009983B3A|nr:porin [Solemya velum gill symbiont]